MGKSQRDLSDSLLASFNAKPKPTHKAPTKVVGAPKAKKTARSREPSKNASDKLKTRNFANSPKALRSTISYQQTEASAADKILDALKQATDVRGGFSDAVKIALRLCPLDEESIRKAWEATKEEDGRVLRHKV